MTHPALEVAARAGAGMSENEWLQASDSRKSHETERSLDAIFAFLDAVQDKPPLKILNVMLVDDMRKHARQLWVTVIAAMAIEIGHKS